MSVRKHRRQTRLAGAGELRYSHGHISAWGAPIWPCRFRIVLEDEQWQIRWKTERPRLLKRVDEKRPSRPPFRFRFGYARLHYSAIAQGLHRTHGSLALREAGIHRSRPVHSRAARPH